LHVSGADAEAFLHGQLSNDLAGLAPDAAQWTAYLNPKGRMLAGFLAWRDGADGIFLCADARTLPALAKRLAMFVLRAKARVADVTAAHAITGILGEKGPREFEVRRGAEMAVGLPAVYGTARHLAIGPAPAGDGAQAPDPHAWARAMIRAGEPWIVPATQEAFVPQMVNFDAVGGINYRKGCYPGQEVVARAHYRGAVKRRMVRAEVAASAQAGGPLFGPDGQESGTVVNACPDDAGGSELLAVIPLTEFGGGAMRLGAPDGPRLVEAALPYALPAAA
jgi:hypothetical protein